MATKIKRINWDEYFLKIAALVAERSTCTRHHVGTVIVKDKKILSTGYNGAPSGLKSCNELGCLRDELKIESATRIEICRATHSEVNAVVQAALHGVKIADATAYCTHSPCTPCVKMLINAKIKRFITYGNYPDENGKQLLKLAGIKFIQMQRPDQTISMLD